MTFIQAMIIAHERANLYGSLLERIKGLMFLSTPHRGADIAYWAGYAAKLTELLELGRGTNKSWVKGLKKNSKEFANISTQFIERAQYLRIRTFYETDRYLGELVRCLSLQLTLGY
jgi:hypothetical protein